MDFTRWLPFTNLLSWERIQYKLVFQSNDTELLRQICWHLIQRFFPCKTWQFRIVPRSLPESDPLSESSPRHRSTDMSPLILADWHQSTETSLLTPLTSLLTPVFWHQSTHTSLKTPLYSHRSNDTSLLTPVFWHQSTDTSLLTPVFWHQSNDTSLLTPVIWHQSPHTILMT